MKLSYTISRFFQEISLSELETLHHLCELERTQILQSLENLQVMEMNQNKSAIKSDFKGLMVFTFNKMPRSFTRVRKIFFYLGLFSCFP